jgi:hypothetical protein
MGYYQGDYYQGDPGFLSFLGKGIKAVAGLAGIGGGPSATKIASKVVAALPGAGAIVPAAKATVTRVGAVLAKHPTATAAAAAGTVGALGTAGMMSAVHPSVMNAMPMGMAGGGMLRGFHMSKPHKGSIPHLVRNRRMRVTNPRALRRAIRRANGFARLAKRVLHFTSPRAPRGRAVFKKRTRKRV